MNRSQRRQAMREMGYRRSETKSGSKPNIRTKHPVPEPETELTPELYSHGLSIIRSGLILPKASDMAQYL